MDDKRHQMMNAINLHSSCVMKSSSTARAHLMGEQPGTAGWSRVWHVWFSTCIFVCKDSHASCSGVHVRACACEGHAHAR